MNWTIRKKLLAGYLACVALMLGMGIFALSRMNAIQANVDVVVTNTVPSVEAVAKIRHTLTMVRLRLWRILTAKVDEIAAEEKTLDEEMKSVGSAQAEYEPLISADDEKKSYEEIKTNMAGYYELQARILDLLKQGKREDALKIMTAEHRERYDAVMKSVSNSFVIVHNQGIDAGKLSAETSANARNLVIISLIAGLVIASGLGLYLSNSLSRPIIAITQSTGTLATQQLPQLTQAVKAIAEGDLSEDLALRIEPVVASTNDEVGEMAKSFNVMGEQINEIVANFQKMTVSLRQMANVADNIAEGDLSIDVEPKSPKDAFGNSFKQMTLGLRENAGVADRIAAGDLTVQVNPKSNRDSFGNSFKQMTLNLRNSMGQIGAGSNHVAAASAQIAAASEQSSRSAQSLSSSAEEITATIHEMAASIRQVASNSENQAAAATETSASITQMATGMKGIASNTQRLAELTGSASRAADEGQKTLATSSRKLLEIGSTVESAGETINRLGQRAESIGKIVETIDDIADQTNLLALNAAIEAARAGEHGLGFAVVADEVRKLAERSARSTREISELIDSIQRESRAAVGQMVTSNQTVKEYIADKSVEYALSTIMTSMQAIVDSTKEIESTIVEQTAGAEQIVRSAQDLMRLTQEISAATSEQSTGASEVARAIDALRATLQQSTQMANELRGSAEELSRQSDNLRGVVNTFKLGKESNVESSFSPEADLAALRPRGGQYLRH